MYVGVCVCVCVCVWACVWVLLHSLPSASCLRMDCSSSVHADVRVEHAYCPGCGLGREKDKRDGGIKREHIAHPNQPPRTARLTQPQAKEEF